jgi:predicted HNH restriction endonuclease
MKKCSLIFSLVIFSLALKAQVSVKDSTQTPVKDSSMVNLRAAKDSIHEVPSKTADYDHLIKTNGDLLVVTIKSENAKEIGFLYPLNTVLNFVPLAQVKEIQYKNGTVKVIDTATPTNLKVLKAENPEEDWKFVKITYNKKDVEGLPDLGPIDSKAEGKKLNTSTDLLERNAILYLQKKAARMGASKVLITNKDIQSAYGELPVVVLTGTAYGR